jgi:peptidoglycan hydrolase-like protein with peptidoglycan-binding domain
MPVPPPPSPVAEPAPVEPAPAEPASVEPASAAPASGPGLKPGAVEMIQQRLESAGVLRAQWASTQQTPGGMSAATRAALTRFQEANHLPPTGELDEATVLKLGLEPRNIFEPAPGSVAGSSE